jgi:hypothetical protein
VTDRTVGTRVERFQQMVYIRPISYVTSIGLALICVPKVPVGNAENYRVRSLQLPEITAFPVHSKTPIIPAEIVHIMLIQKDVISAIFLGKFLKFSTEQNLSHNQ